MKKKSLLMLGLLWQGLAAGQTFEMLDLGNFETPIHCDGQLFWNHDSIMGFEWPRTNVPADEKTCATTGHLWMGGTDSNGALHVAAQTYRQQDYPYIPGPVNATGNWNRVWKISRQEVNQFQTDLANSAVNFSQYPSIQSWPAFAMNSMGNNVAVAPFIDMDNNPFAYDPLAGDYPDFPGDQAIFAVFHDSTSGPGLGVEIQLFAYVWNCPTLNYHDVCFLRYRIANISTLQYTDFHTGLFMDMGLGDETDDYTGSDSSLGMVYAYNADSVDGQYGLNPPAFGVLSLSQPAEHGMYYFNNFSLTGNPEQAVQYYNYMRGRWKDGSELVNDGGDGHDPGGSPATDWAFPGDAGFCVSAPPAGWTEASAGNPFYDRSSLISSDASVLQPAELRILEYAVFPARANNNQNLGSVCELKALASNVLQYYATASTPCSSTSSVPPSSESSFTLFPNPGSDELRLQFSAVPMRTIRISFINTLGQIAMETSAGPAPVVEIETESLPAGLYLVQVDMGSEVKALRWVKE